MSKFILITINIIKFHTLPHRLIFHIYPDCAVLKLSLTHALGSQCLLVLQQPKRSLLCYTRIKFNKRERGIYSIYSSKNARDVNGIWWVRERGGNFRMHTRVFYECMSTQARRLNISWICNSSVNKYYFSFNPTQWQ